MSKRANPTKKSTRSDNSSGENAGHNANMPVASRASDLKLLAEELLDTLIGAVKASAGVVRILPAQGQALQVISSIGLPAELVATGSTSDLVCEVCGKTAIGNGIYYADISTCKLRQDCLYAKCQFQSIIIAPLEGDSSPGYLKGIATLFFSNAPESVGHVMKTSRAFAHLLGTLIEQSKLNRETKRADLIAERQMIANEIHDSLAQTLAYARMRTHLLIESVRTGNKLMSSKYSHEIDEALEQGQKTVRELITNFRCEMDPSGLLHAIQVLTGQFSERNNIALEYINRVADMDLPLEYEIQIYYIVREALANIASHSAATRARLTIHSNGSNYVFAIEDNGSGGCTSVPTEGHYGIKIMRERAARINGKIYIKSMEGSGTSVQLSFQVAVTREERG